MSRRKSVTNSFKHDKPVPLISPRPPDHHLIDAISASVIDTADELSAPVEVHRVPADQLQLTLEQQNEVFTKVITAVDPNVSKALTQFDYNDGTFKAKPTQSHTAVHFVMEGTLLHIDSEEAKEQIAWVERNGDRIVTIKTHSTCATDTNDDSPRHTGAHDDDDDNKVRSAAAASTGGNERALKNQFNYSERASATINPAMRDRSVATEPPPTVTYSAQVTHWEIVDTYVDELEKQIAAREAKEKTSKKKSSEDDEDKATADTANPDIFHSTACALALKTMERLINQNGDAATFIDYAYYNNDISPPTNPAAAAIINTSAAAAQSVVDKAKSGFLPLWKFTSSPSNNKTVTCIQFNPLFEDLFAVGYGSYEFGRTVTGTVAVYTLKNSAHPEYTLTTASGVMCMSFHPVHAALLCVGLYDGTVAVYDIRQSQTGGAPLYLATSPQVVHRDPVWQVVWDSHTTDSEGKARALSFYSVSSDGHVKQWILGRQELGCELVVSLRPTQPNTPATATAATTKQDTKSLSSSSPVPLSSSSPVAAPSNSGLSSSFSSGSCADFNPHIPTQFIVGTEEGTLQLYNQSYNSTQFIREYTGHDMSVYAVRWNTYHPGIFISCSADWSVKIWEIQVSTAVLSFDLGCAVSDVCWSPFSSTIFCIVTVDGRVRLYDINVNKHDAIAEYKLTNNPTAHATSGAKEVNNVNGNNQTGVKSAKLTHLTFNTNKPIICVGDDRGAVTVIKLIKPSGVPTSLSATLAADISEECMRLDRLLIIPGRNSTPEQLPAYLKAFVDSYSSVKAAAEKQRADAKAAELAALAGAKSPLTSPKAGGRTVKDEE